MWYSFRSPTASVPTASRSVNAFSPVCFLFQAICPYSPAPAQILAALHDACLRIGDAAVEDDKQPTLSKLSEGVATVLQSCTLLYASDFALAIECCTAVLACLGDMLSRRSLPWPTGGGTVLAPEEVEILDKVILVLTKATSSVTDEPVLLAAVACLDEAGIPLCVRCLASLQPPVMLGVVNVLRSCTPPLFTHAVAETLVGKLARCEFLFVLFRVMKAFRKGDDAIRVTTDVVHSILRVTGECKHV